MAQEPTAIHCASAEAAQLIKQATDYRIPRRCSKPRSQLPAWKDRQGWAWAKSSARQPSYSKRAGAGAASAALRLASGLEAR